MVKIVIWQAAILVVCTALVAIFAGVLTSVSCILGGLCYLLPTSATALLLNCFRSSPQVAFLGFLIGESLKVMMSIALMVLVFMQYRELEWLPFLMGFLAVSHVVFLMIWKSVYYDK